MRLPILVLPITVFVVTTAAVPVPTKSFFKCLIPSGKPSQSSRQPLPESDFSSLSLQEPNQRFSSSSLSSLPEDSGSTAPPKATHLGFKWLGKPASLKTQMEWYDIAENLQKTHFAKLGKFKDVAITPNTEQTSATCTFYGPTKKKSLSVTVPCAPQPLLENEHPSSSPPSSPESNPPPAASTAATDALNLKWVGKAASPETETAWFERARDVHKYLVGAGPFQDVAIMLVGDRMSAMKFSGDKGSFCVLVPKVPQAGWNPVPQAVCTY